MTNPVAKSCAVLGLLLGMGAWAVAVTSAVTADTTNQTAMWIFAALLAGAIVLIGGSMLSIVAASHGRWEAAARKILSIGAVFDHTPGPHDRPGGMRE